jgi:L-asparaginase II
VIARRGGARESEHLVAWCVVGPDGAPAGPDADLPVFARSASKPLQALGSVRAGVLERFGLGSEHLAVSCGSHGGGAQHVTRVEGILRASGVGEDRLACGTMAPRDRRARRALREPPGMLHHNCSGKHALGLARCLVEGWPLDGYFRAGHPLQLAMRRCVAEACGVADEEVEEAVDGCGMRTFAVPLATLAAAFGALAGGRLGPAGDRCAAAMRAHPELVAFEGAIDTELMRAEPGLVAKIGAEGVLAVGLADGRGLALKVRDGGARAVGPAGVALVRAELGLAAVVPDELAVVPIMNSRGLRVGELRHAPERP